MSILSLGWFAAQGYTENWSLATTGSSSCLSKGDQVGKPLRIHLGFGHCSNNAILVITGGSSVFLAMNGSVSSALLQGGEIDQTGIGDADYHYLQLSMVVSNQETVQNVSYFAAFSFKKLHEISCIPPSPCTVLGTVAPESRNTQKF